MANNTNASNTTAFQQEFAYQSGQKPTDQQVAAAKRMGMTDAAIAEMQSSGMSYNQWTHIVPGTAMLAWFDAKYPDASYVVSSMSSKPAQDDYVVYCNVGGSTGESFEISLSQIDGQPSYRETYFPIYAKSEYSAKIGEFVAAAATQQGISSEAYLVNASLSGGDAANSATQAMENVLSHAGTIIVYVSQTASLSESAYRAFADSCIQRMSQAGCEGSYCFDYLLDSFTSYPFTKINAEAVVSSNTSDKPTRQWRVLGSF